MNKTTGLVDQNAPYVSATCDLCEARKVVVVKTIAGQMLDNEPVQNFGPFNAHRSCYESWRLREVSK